MNHSDTSATASTSSQKTEAVVYANDTVQIKNGRLTLKQKKIDWARNTAALQCGCDSTSLLCVSLYHSQ